MKILLFTLEYPPFKGGVANYYENLVKHYPEPNNIFVLNNNDNKLLKPHWLFSIFKLSREIKKNKIDHIIVGHLLPLGTVVYLFSKFRKIKYSVILHGMDFTYALRKARKKRLAKKILRKAENIICSNSYVAKLVQETFGLETKIHVINPGIDTEAKSNNSETKDAQIKDKYKLNGKIVLFSVGRLVKRKGFDKVVQAMREVVKSCPNLYYFIAGDGPDKKYIYNLAEGVPNIIFLGKINDEDKWAWLEICDIFITVSREIAGDFEGFGIVYLEANSRGKPVIAGDSGGVRDAVKSAYSGILVDPENVNRIANAIITLAKNENLRKKLGEQGRARVLREFKWEDKARNIYKIICNII